MIAEKVDAFIEAANKEYGSELATDNVKPKPEDWTGSLNDFDNIKLSFNVIGLESLVPRTPDDVVNMPIPIMMRGGHDALVDLLGD